jgi:hypothetical protein
MCLLIASMLFRRTTQTASLFFYLVLDSKQYEASFKTWVRFLLRISRLSLKQADQNCVPSSLPKQSIVPD